MTDETLVASDITLIITTHNQIPHLRCILNVIDEGERLPEQIIVAEDGNDAGTSAVIAEAVKKLHTPLIHLTQEYHNFQKASILNSAIAAATGDYLVFLDGDCIPHKNFISDHQKLSHKSTFVQGRRAFIKESAVADFLTGNSSLMKLLLTGKMRAAFKGLRLPLPLVREDQNLHGTLGCNIGIWREDLVAINGYDESFVGWGKEDSDLVARLFHLGRKRRIVHSHAIVFHLNHPIADRFNLLSNENRLTETLASRRIRCELGLDRH